MKKDEVYSKLGEFFYRVFDKISKKLKLDKLSDKVITRANNNKTATFGIIISGMLLCTIIIFGDSIIKFKHPKQESISATSTIDSLKRGFSDPTQRLNNQLESYYYMKSFQGEIEELLAKDTLTPQDSLRLLEIYDIMMEEEIKFYKNGETQY